MFDAFVQWAEAVDFWGQWMPTVPSSHKLSLGEYLWSPAWKHFDNSYYGNDGWVQPDHGCPVTIRPSAFEYHQESAGFDCSVDSGFTLHLPDAELVRGHGSYLDGRRSGLSQSRRGRSSRKTRAATKAGRQLYCFGATWLKR